MLRAALTHTKPLHGPGMLIAGSIWDFATLGRIDRFADNALLATYVTLLAALLVLEIRLHDDAPVPAWARRRATWIGYGTQFLFGGLFSAYVVFYSRSAGLGRSGLFVALLAALLVTNEVADRRLRGPDVRVPLFWLVLTSFLLFFVPVCTGVLVGLPAAGLMASALVVGLLVAARRPRSGEELRAVLVRPGIACGAMLVALLGLQSLGLVPAVPLSLDEAGAFHAVRRDRDGYHLVYEDPGLRFWSEHDAVFHWRAGERVWCFTAVFAPTGVTLDVVHRWERWDDVEGWQTTNTIPYRLQGGREGGFRGYTYKDHTSPGAWRVRVETPSGREIGRVRFDLVEGEARSLVERVY